MKKIFFPFLVFVLISTASFPQNFKYAWIINPDIGQAGADTALTNIIANINLYKDLEFAAVTGNLTAHGSNDELEILKTILDKLSVPYHIIPGENDLRWSESAGHKIKSVFGADHFSFDHNNTWQIGLNSAAVWRSGGGHFSPEEISWLAGSLKKIPKTREIFLYSYFPFDDKTDNWFTISNMLSDHNVTALFASDGKEKTVTSTAVIPTITGVNASDGKSWFYNVIENKSDSLIFYEVSGSTTKWKDGVSSRWGGFPKRYVKLAQTDSAQFINYSNPAGKNLPLLNANVLWQKNLNSTSLTNLLTADDRIFATTENGKIFCFDTTGKTIWQYDSKETIVSRPVVNENILAAATLQGDLISLNAKTGEMIQVIGIGEPLTSQLVTTEVEYNGNKTTAVIVGTSAGSIYCYELSTFEMIWENHSAHGLIRTLPLILNHRLFFGSQDGFLYCVDDRTGALYWKWNDGPGGAESRQEGNDFYTAPSVCTPLSDGSSVYISAPDKFVSRIDFLLGITKWRKDFQSWESLALTNDRKTLIVKSISNRIVFVSAKDGKIIKEINLNYGFDLNPAQPIEWKGNFLIPAENGILYLIDKNYKSKPLMFLGNCRLNSIENVKDNIFAVSNMDGKIVCFVLK